MQGERKAKKKKNHGYTRMVRETDRKCYKTILIRNQKLVLSVLLAQNYSKVFI